VSHHCHCCTQLAWDRVIALGQQSAGALRALLAAAAEGEVDLSAALDQVVAQCDVSSLLGLTHAGECRAHTL
jgi:hypothetical protein